MGLATVSSLPQHVEPLLLFTTWNVCSLTTGGATWSRNGYKPTGNVCDGFARRRSDQGFEPTASLAMRSASLILQLSSMI
jgi:hypothetical protein